MRSKRTPKALLQTVLFRLGYVVRRLDAEERSAFYEFQKRDNAVLGQVFGGDAERLNELRQRYAGVQLPIAVHSAWGARRDRKNLVDVGLAGIDLARFRASGSYVWNYYGPVSSEVSRLKYFIFHQSVQASDEAKLLTRLTEDGAFGAPTVEFEGTGLISRDLLDSVSEINFLQRHLGVLDNDDARVLDIGAGYGRMAYRLLEANPNMTGYTCVDAIPESTFLCEYYLGFRGLQDRSVVLPLDEVDQRLEGHFDVALNIHSFSECTYDAVEWWLQRVRKLGVQHLMIVPNPGKEFVHDEERFTTTEQDQTKRNYYALLTSLGYELVARQPVLDSASAEILEVEDVMFLFKLNAAE